MVFCRILNCFIFSNHSVTIILFVANTIVAFKIIVEGNVDECADVNVDVHVHIVVIVVWNVDVVDANCNIGLLQDFFLFLVLSLL